MEQGRRELPTDGLGQPSSTSEASRLLEYRFESLTFGVQKDRRYHEKLYSFYSHWRDRMKIVTAIAGSGAFLLVVAKIKPWDEVISAFIALWATLDIIVSPDKKSDKARDLGEKYADLAGRIEEAERNERNLHHFSKARMQIAKEEMPLKRIVDLEARNDECRARNYPPEDQVPLSHWQRAFGYYFTFGMPRLEKWKSDRQRGLAQATKG